MNTYFTGYNTPESIDAKVSSAMKNVFLKMFLGLLVTAVVAWFVAATAATSGSFLMFLAQNSWVYFALSILEVGLVIWITARLHRMASGMATGLFFLFAAVNGLTLSVIFLAYSLAAIFKTFLITAGVFGAMSVYGYLTNKDLTKMGSLLVMALFGLIIASVVNIFWGNSTMELIISFAGVAIFIGITAWDTQRIKQMAYADPSMGEGRIATLGALSLYLDFINLFLYLLRFLNASRD